MMAGVIPFTGPATRAIVIVQLNAAQWHHTTHGRDVPAGSFESRNSGVNDFRQVVADALEVAECTGLPVMVHAYQDAVRPLHEFGPPSSFRRYRRPRQTLSELFGWPEDGAA